MPIELMKRKSWDISKLIKEQKQTRRRILEISFKLRLSHQGSCLSAVDLIDAVYRVKKPEEKFVLSNGHAGIALYVVLEKYGFIKEPSIIESLHVHPDRNPAIGIDVSTGSLGHGLPIALGMALANRKKRVYCMISDGECAEGSIWETLRIVSDKKVYNLKIIVNANGWGAYDPIDIRVLKKRLRAFGYQIVEVDGHNQHLIKKALLVKRIDRPVLIFAKTTVEHFPFLKGQDAHYHVISEEEYRLAMRVLK